ncbi:uncharacterized protein BYT42DRAFT_564446 [Radiomyces spectabilis]|uniref:uncharacterized protein n=1 Tax=Radiomyces spectabilis TaxID=64574 RepID=UPI002220E384|nr:uncharacterized protein BYT42DRAFT_564446 [Radiomyces spectabilis]KAI8385026.1 hypothetical protein BYT42DRAFT_564446 [Radiomyces spectabilis]
MQRHRDNLYLCTKYDAHINAEICSSLAPSNTTSCTKAKDGTMVTLRAQQQEVDAGVDERTIDETQLYQDARYNSDLGTFWRIYSFSELSKNDKFKPVSELASMNLVVARMLAMDDPMTQYVQKCQMHTCTAYCMPEGQQFCRFGIAPCEEVYCDNGRYFYERGGEDAMINPYNPFLLRLVQSNMDIHLTVVPGHCTISAIPYKGGLFLCSDFGLCKRSAEQSPAFSSKKVILKSSSH